MKGCQAQAGDLSITVSNPNVGLVKDVQIISAISATEFVGDKVTAVSALGFNFISFS